MKPDRTRRNLGQAVVTILGHPTFDLQLTGDICSDLRQRRNRTSEQARHKEKMNLPTRLIQKKQNIEHSEIDSKIGDLAPRK